MSGVFTGFAVLLATVAFGNASARRGVLPAHSHEVLARVAVRRCMLDDTLVR